MLKHVLVVMLLAPRADRYDDMPPRHLPKSESSSAKPGTLQRKKEMLRKRGNPKMKVRDESYGNDAFYDFDSIMELIEDSPELFVEIVDRIIETSMIPFETLEKVYKKIGKNLGK